MRSLVLLRWWYVVAMVGSQPVLGGVILDTVSDSSYLALAAEPEYSAVGSITWNEGGTGYIGSGTYLGDGWVLTAAHVADGTDFVGGGQSNWNFSLGSTSYAADEFYVHPDWTSSQGDLAEGVDLALVKLTTDSINVDDVLLYEGTNEDDYIATMVGYGSTGTGDEGYVEYSSGTKRAGQNEIDVFGGGQRVRGFDDAIMFVDFDSPDGDSSLWGSSTPLDLEYLIAPGDSGGGLFIDVGGETYLAGVTSFGLATDGLVDSDYGDAGGFIRVSQYIDWIDEVTGLLSEEVLVALPGDFNLDGIVDAADYSVWRDTLGQAVDPGIGADANGDGVIDEADYDLWRSNYGSDAEGEGLVVMSVPEASSVLLVLLGLQTFLLKRPSQ